ncbi:hypothetical protein L21SP5_02185 [Salinivirga cyanobacteriivorans]|uniref:Uncharacterized protein n=1 Tax=Salinivirga cyanobacteriivorans TaxID=1307839 RepID=A0A0S2I0E9_9BACT|nr:hypothetical protein [Salinivirga cyanobacteriivorans]ALO15818.1 hypothetical protein L21SP5_02185 [Salinivirga cyanobacteriivorans]
MKRLFISFFFLVNFVILFAQKDHINCVIFVDGKLPGLESLNVSVKWSDSIQVDLDYVIGEFQLSKEDKNLIESLDPNKELMMTVKYFEKSKTYMYTSKIDAGWLTYRYLIARITNLNKKKEKYYFGFSTPGPSNHFIKKEYNMLE